MSEKTKEKIVVWAQVGFLIALFLYYKFMWTEKVENVLLFCLWANIVFGLMRLFNTITDYLESSSQEKNLGSKKASIHDWTMLFIGIDMAASGRFVIAGFLATVFVLSQVQIEGKNEHITCD